MYRPIARGLITHVDEASAIIKGLNQYKKKGNDYENLIKLFDGGMIKSDRKGGLDFPRNPVLHLSVGSSDLYSIHYLGRWIT